MWWAGFKAHDLGFKRLIAEKLKDFGIELEMDAVDRDGAPTVSEAEAATV